MPAPWDGMAARAFKQSICASEAPLSFMASSAPTQRALAAESSSSAAASGVSAGSATLRAGATKPPTEEAALELMPLATETTAKSRVSSMASSKTLSANSLALCGVEHTLPPPRVMTEVCLLCTRDARIAVSWASSPASAPTSSAASPALPTDSTGEGLRCTAVARSAVASVSSPASAVFWGSWSALPTDVTGEGMLARSADALASSPASALASCGSSAAWSALPDDAK
mmetsp:Transcript_91493/g.258662  ORF Transcript_91493/g.258662 Transcript_91493/m.258662 type:complete len:229 (-) Transcript_91493:804-1490(-)